MNPFKFETAIAITLFNIPSKFEWHLNATEKPTQHPSRNAT